MGAALQHLFGPGDLNWLDWRVLFYGLGRGLLWLVVISSCWSMYGYFLRFYGGVRKNLGTNDGAQKRGEPDALGVHVNLIGEKERSTTRR
jgi:hypothetical protein